MGLVSNTFPRKVLSIQVLQQQEERVPKAKIGAEIHGRAHSKIHGIVMICGLHKG